MKKQKSIFYDTLETIPLYNFLKCLCENDLSFLYKEVPTERNEEAEQDLFMELSEQFAVLSAGKSFDFTDLKRIVSLRTDIAILESSLGLLNEVTDEIKAILQQRGIRLTSDNAKNAMRVSAKIEMLLREYTKLVEKEKNEKDKEKPTMEHYYKLLILISSHFKFHLDIHVITVADFCGYYGQFQEELKQFSKIKNKDV